MPKPLRRSAIFAVGTGGLLLASMGPAVAFLPSASDLLQNANVRIAGQTINFGSVGDFINQSISGSGSFLGNLTSTVRGILVNQNPCISVPTGGTAAQFCPFTNQQISGLLGPLGLPDTAAIGGIAADILQQELGAAPGNRRSGGAFGLNPTHLALIAEREGRQLLVQAVVDSRLSEDGQMQVAAEGEQVALVTANSLEASATAQGQVITQDIMKQIALQQGQEAIANYQIYSQLVTNGVTGLYAMEAQNDIRAHLDREEERRILQTGTALTQTFNDYAAFAAALPQ